MDFSPGRLCVQFSSVQWLSHVWLFATPWTTARQASLSITNSQSLPKLMSIKSVMPSNHLILCHPLLLLPSIFPSIRVFSDESALHIRWPKYWSFSFNISPSNEHPRLISFRMDWLDLLAVQGTLKSLLQRLCVHVLFAKRKSFCMWSKTWAEPLGRWAGRELTEATMRQRAILFVAKERAIRSHPLAGRSIPASVSLFLFSLFLHCLLKKWAHCPRKLSSIEGGVWLEV